METRVIGIDDDRVHQQPQPKQRQWARNHPPSLPELPRDGANPRLPYFDAQSSRFYYLPVAMMSGVVEEMTGRNVLDLEIVGSRNGPLNSWISMSGKNILETAVQS